MTVNDAWPTSSEVVLIMLGHMTDHMTCIHPQVWGACPVYRAQKLIQVNVADKGVQVQGSPLLVLTGPDGTNHTLYRCLLAEPKVRYHGYVHVQLIVG